MAIPEGAIWVRLPRFIGDAVMIHRAMDPLRAMGLKLVAWGPAHVVDLFEGSEAFSAVVTDPETKLGASDMARLLRIHRPSAVLNLPRSTRASLAAFLAFIPLRAGWSESGGWLLCNRSLSFRRSGGHQTARYENLLKKAFPGMPVDCPHAPFKPRASAMEEASEHTKALGRPYVVFALGAACWNKRLGRNVWADLARSLQGRGQGIVFLGSSGEDEVLARALMEDLQGPLNLTGRTGLAQSAGIIANAEGLIGNDSAMAHLAAACGIPTTVVCGPTDAEITAPPGAWVRVVHKKGLDCLPCGRMDCRTAGHPCMQALEAERILSALEEAMTIVQNPASPQAPGHP